MYTYLDCDLKERTLPEGVRITDGPRKNWYNRPWSPLTKFVLVKQDDGEQFYATLTEASIRLNVTMYYLTKQIREMQHGETFKNFIIPRKIFVDQTGSEYSRAWNYYWEY